MILIENLRKAVKVCDSNKVSWAIVILSIVIGISAMLCYVDHADEIPQNVSYSNNFSIPSESTLIEEFSDIRIEIVKEESNLTYGKGGIPIVPKTLNSEEFEVQEFSRYCYTIYTIQNSESGFAEVELFLYGISGKDVYQTSYTYNAGRIVAKENSFSPLGLEIEPNYDATHFEFDKIEEVVDFTVNFENNNGETWCRVVLVSFAAFGVLTFFIIAIADAILIALLSIAIHIAKYREYKSKKKKEVEE